MPKKPPRYKSDFAKMDAVPGKPDAESPEIKRKDIGVGLIEVSDPFGPLLHLRRRATGGAKKRPLYMLVDQDILAFFRGTGPGWQTRMNAVLRKAVPRNALSRIAAPRLGAVAKRSPNGVKKTKRTA
jgi:hypothetical protein